MTTTRTTPAIASLRPLPVDDPGAFVAVDAALPELRPHDLLVEVAAVSVNPVDVKRRASFRPDGAPLVLGFDAVGTVREVGPAVTLFAPGDRVFHAGTVDRPGTNAVLHVVDERIVGRAPASLSAADAAALPLTSITAWEMLVDRLRLTEASTGTLLVVGATGGVGSMVLQLAETLLPGVRTIATASRPEGVDWVTSLGATPSSTTAATCGPRSARPRRTGSTRSSPRTPPVRSRSTRTCSARSAPSSRSTTPGRSTWCRSRRSRSPGTGS